MKNNVEAYYTFGLLIVVVAAFYSFGFVMGRDAERSKAIAAGVGQWTVNPTNGKTTFTYDRP